jgi:2'-5' RNA ligase
MHRLFVALRPPPPIRRQLVAIAGGVPNARWQDDEQLHVTVRFIGQVERPLAEEIAVILANVRATPPRVALAGIGSFDRQGRTDAIWAGMTPHDALTALHRKVDRALIQLGLQPERRAYLPHITLARLPRHAHAEPEIARFAATHAALASEPFTLDHLILFESHLGHAGARYEAIERWPLELT